MDAFAWGVVAAVAGVVAALAAVAALIPRRRDRKEVSGAYEGHGTAALPTGAEKDKRVVVGEIPQQPLGFQPRADLLAAMDVPGAGFQVVVVYAVTGMRGVGKTHLAAAYARARLAERWRLVAWINADDLGAVLAGLAAAATELGLSTGEDDAEAAGRAVRHWLESDGDRCLLVFDNATGSELLQPFLPVVGAARIIITSNQQSMANLGTAVPVDVFSEQEALSFLAERTGPADIDGARVLAVELGYLPLALAQAAAVIAEQRLPYDTYLERLRAIPVGELLTPVEAGQYPHGLAAAVLLSLDAVRAGPPRAADETGACIAVMELVAVMSPGGVRRSLLHEAARQNISDRFGQPGGEVSAEVVDRALARLAGGSLLTFSLDGSRVSAHRLVMRVIREQLAGRDALEIVCAVAGLLLGALADSLESTWHDNRPAVRDLAEQIIALHESSAGCPANSDLTLGIIDLRSRAVSFLNDLGDSPAQAILIAEPLLTIFNGGGYQVWSPGAR